MPPSMFSRPIRQASDFLTSHQDADGFWRDFRLDPGASDAWITACVGFALSHVEGCRESVLKAADALCAIRRPQGWGYNALTACDADTTAWVIRFLSVAGAVSAAEATELMRFYITPSHRVRTFASTDRFGSWAHAHDEVAPIVAMALLSCGASGPVKLLRQNCIAQESWTPFWWQCRSYVCAQNLEFLAVSGGIPERIKKRESEAFERLCASAAPSSFDLAHRLVAARYLDQPLGDAVLLQMQQNDGSWPPSAELLVPDQQDGSIKGPPYADTQRLFSTAMAVLALVKTEDFFQNRRLLSYPRDDAHGDKNNA